MALPWIANVCFPRLFRLRTHPAFVCEVLSRLLLGRSHAEARWMLAREALGNEVGVRVRGLVGEFV